MQISCIMQPLFAEFLHFLCPAPMSACFRLSARAMMPACGDAIWRPRGMVQMKLLFASMIGLLACALGGGAGLAQEPANDYPEALKLKVATAISPLSPPIQMKLTWQGGDKPALLATTNLPDGAVLQVRLRKPWLPDAQARLSIGLAACADGNCFPPGTPRGNMGDRVTIENGTFRAGPFTYGGAPLAPGVYPIDIIIETNNYNGPHPEMFHKVYDGQLVIGSSERRAVSDVLTAAQRGEIGARSRECWTKDAGARSLDQLSVVLTVVTDQTGTVRIASVAEEDRGKMSDPIFQAFAERAFRAVRDPRCSTLPLPAEMLGHNNTLTFRFRP